MARVLAVANQKGGVAKTTTTHSLGAGLAELGERVLLVDLDPQACLTYSLGVDPDTIDASLHDVLAGRAEAADVVGKSGDLTPPPPTIHLVRAAVARVLPPPPPPLPGTAGRPRRPLRRPRPRRPDPQVRALRRSAGPGPVDPDPRPPLGRRRGLPGHRPAAPPGGRKMTDPL